MTNNKRIIFEPGKELGINKEQAESLKQPAAQLEELIRLLSIWSEKAATELEGYGYSTENVDKQIFTIKAGLSTLYCFPGKIPDNTNINEKAACQVLKAVQPLWESLFTDNKCLIANLGIELGLAVAKAHATPFEGLAVTGKRRKEIPIEAGKARGKQQTEERQPEWKIWNNKKDQIVKDNPNLTGESKIASLVKKELKLTESLKTIKNRIFPR